MLLSIIIVNYKTSELVESCITSLKKLLGDKIGKDIEIIVVDNHSGDEEIEKLQKLRDKEGFKLLTSKINIGFGAGCNFGTTISQGKYLLFLNSDTSSPFGIFEMTQFMEKENPGILGGRLINENGKYEKSAGNFFNLINLFLMLFVGNDRIVRFSPNSYRKVDFVSGGFLMVKKEDFEKLKGFDEDYFMYMEDMDLCFRASKIGIATYFYPQASVIHKKHGSSNRSFAIFNIYKSLLIFYKKNTSNVKYNIAKFLLRVKAEIALLLGKLLKKSYLSQTYEKTLELFR